MRYNICDHLVVTKTIDRYNKQICSDGSTMVFCECKCKDCGLEWKTLNRESTNITTQDYILHFNKQEHSPNSPMIKVVKERDNNDMDMYVDYEECKVCKKYLQQNHQMGV